ncbi:hypothetical protein MHY85_10450 [Cellulomonas sp. ACRRI]|uniref:hypothetical protein n=1 Tax=Cellulomonas sp. ACRRI TaxID=2918188 RepID=UPI001EF29773|nr:hypothetical protein [Cellulomonas sp. ACRRI]MCG7286388.1 hypothetical protein [Cellulomonas sp. ACRRI]
MELALLFAVQHQVRGALLPPLEGSDGHPGLLDLVVPPATGSDAESRFVATPRVNRLRQAKQALARLEREGLLESDGGRGNARRYWMMEETAVGDGPTAKRYIRPTNAATFTLPVEFYTQGWIHLLDDSELAALLMFLVRQEQAGEGLGFKVLGEHRLRQFCLARDTLDRHVFLEDVGLLRHVPADSRRADGTVVDARTGAPLEPHTYWTVPEGLQAPALNAVLAAIA